MAHPEPHLRIAAEARPLKARLGPTAWAVLEDVALDAAADGASRLVAATSSRRVAANLGLTPGTAARALGRLRSMGLLSYTRLDGAAGRFGLSAYLLGVLPGVEVAGAPSGPAPGADSPAGIAPGVEGPHPEPPCVDEPRGEDAPVAGGRGSAGRRCAPTKAPGGQLDLLGAIAGEAVHDSPPPGPSERSGRWPPARASRTIPHAPTTSSIERPSRPRTRPTTSTHPP